MDQTVLAFGMPGGWEWILILLVALLVFGRRLPDVARSVGRSIVEFKKGIREIETDIDDKSRVDQSKPGKLERKSDAAGETSRPAEEQRQPAGESRASG
jgi:sec-independent protein translocase protein TatA